MTTEEHTLRLLLRQIQYEADGVVSLLLTDPAGTPLPAWRPGAHLELELPSGLVRQYSLCGDPSDRTGYRVAVLREDGGRGGSKEIHTALPVGTQLTVRGPRNHFELAESDAYVFIAGGVGITPILAMMRSLAGHKRWELHYGGRTLTSMAFLGQLAEYGGNVEIVPQDREGLLDIEGILAGVKPDALVYCCGPEPLLTTVRKRCEELGIAGRLHIERFSSSEEALAEAEAARSGDGFEVELARTDRVVWVESGRTVLDTLRDVLPELPSSCEEGVCGTCEVHVLDGIPEHHDQILSDAEREEGMSMFICVSRSKSPRIVLDL
ncbi:PDR/VanB family oxidoreductase [Streptomyces sp. NPDC001315]|uniref:PDR/VanB family oxidoreductase n=1 Tax=Streptomyces sp. NPDC001315 TaxID=3364562 RepID=UPI00369C3FF8